METFLHTLRRADEGITGSFDRAFAPAHNPWRHLGALVFLCLVTAMATGIVAYAWYDTSVQGAYASGLRLQNDPLLLGRLLRGLHRYAADACMLLSVLHLLREAARGHFRGVRWYSWLTGIALVGLVWLSGVTGLWLLWDARALFSLSATAVCRHMQAHAGTCKHMQAHGFMCSALHWPGCGHRRPWRLKHWPCWPLWHCCGRP